MQNKKILLGHGSGGKLMHGLIRSLLLKKLNNPILKELSDSALIKYKDRLAFTTDSFVVSPLWFPGGDIGKLAVCGTVNDLVMLDRILEKIVDSISSHAKSAGVYFVTGDIKVVEKGAADKIFINTSGIGRIIKNRNLSHRNIEPDDKIIITGSIGQHGLAVLAKRNELGLGFNIQSDCAALNNLILPILKKTALIKFMRDPTRGGVATTLNEIAAATRLGIIIDEKAIPISGKVKVASELLGIDPLYVACEGRAILVVKNTAANKVLGLLRKHPQGKDAEIIGTVVRQPRERVILNTVLGTQRIVDMLISEPLPRIC
ncbi:MAG: hydrogenase expression/formation protein HypE [Candidatus Omnitrophica bacterium]|nr:hydrogenase expression/formation protein HypE [Candidatus Omnitrophota bacterium]